MRVLHPERNDSTRLPGQIIAAYWSGERIPVIAERLRWPESYVRAVLVQAGGKLAGSRLPDETIQRMGEMVEDGCSHTEIRTTLRVDNRTLQEWYPGTAWAVGGTPEANEVRKMKAQLRAIPDVLV